MSLYLLLSQSCNLGCIYCLNGKRTYRTGRNLQMAEEATSTWEAAAEAKSSVALDAAHTVYC